MPLSTAGAASAARGTLPTAPASVPAKISSRQSIPARDARGRPGARLHPLVGRQEELARLDASLHGQGPPVVLLAGEPGIGKTRLLREVARRAVGAGWVVVPGGCHRQGGEEPYSPLLEALQTHLAGHDLHALHEVLAGCAGLAHLLPELAGILEPLPAATMAPEHQRRLMVEAMARLLANIAGPAGALLLLDDLQWAGRDTLELLAMLVRRARAPLRIVGAYRDTEVGPADPLPHMVADLVQAGMVDLHTLGPLDGNEAASLLEYVLGGVAHAGPEIVARVLERAGGTPFFLVSYAQALRLGGNETVPWDLAATVRQRVTLAADAAEVLNTAAVVGRRVPRALLLAVAGPPVEVVLAGLDAACRARLLIEDGPDGYVFGHDVIREVIEEDLGAGWRAALHGRVASVLEQGIVRASPELLAYHYSRSDEPQRAVSHLEDAADYAVAHYAYGQAEHHYRELITSLEGLGQRGEAARVREKLAELLRRVGRFADAHDVVTAATSWYRSAGDLEGTARATALLSLILEKQGESEEARRHLDEVARQLERGGQGGVPSPAAAQVWQQLATVHGGQGRFEEMLRAADRAAEIAGALGDEELRAKADERRGFALNNLGRLAEAREALAGAIPPLEAAGALPELVGSIANLAENRRVAGDLVEALRLSKRALDLAVRTGMDRSEMAQSLNQAEILTAIGEWASARRQITRAEEIGQTGETEAYVAVLVPYHLAELALRQGRWEEAGELLRGAVTEPPGANPFAGELASALLTELDLIQGKPQDACQRLMDLLDQPAANRILILPLLAWTHLELGEPDRGLALAREAAREIREQHMLLYLPEAQRIEGMALVRLGRTEEASTVLTAGLERARAMPLPYIEARILVELGMLSRAERRDAQGRDELEEALAIFQRLGASRDVAEVERALTTLRDEDSVNW